MATKLNSHLKGKRKNPLLNQPAKVKSADTVEVASTAPTNVTANAQAEVPKFKVWHIRELQDIAEVDEWQMDKCLHFLSHLIRKCRIMKRRLVEFTYHEQGRISYIMQDIATGEFFQEPKPIDEDPLA